MGGGTFCVRNGVSRTDAIIEVLHEAHYNSKKKGVQPSKTATLPESLGNGAGEENVSQIYDLWMTCAVNQSIFRRSAIMKGRRTGRCQNERRRSLRVPADGSES
jgi:hypothetical protein